MLREYRHKITTYGQASPPWIADGVVQILQNHFADHIKEKKTLSIIDVGCGLGEQMKIINQRLPGLFHNINGIDWSPATVHKHANDGQSIYNNVSLCDSKNLPYQDKIFDIALSMENLEHLYGEYSIDAISELSRIAKYVIITTPNPEDIVNKNWLLQEIAEAVLDNITINIHDYICLESAVHKSSIFPLSMAEAGFVVYKSNHGFYFGDSRNIFPDRVKVVGIDESDLDKYCMIDKNDDNSDLKLRYLALLAKSIQMHYDICAHPYFRTSSVK